MRRAFQIIALLGLSGLLYADYNGKAQVACSGCTSSVTATATFARAQTYWLGYSRAGDWYVYDTSNGTRRRIVMSMVFNDGSSPEQLDLWNLLLRTVTGSAVPSDLQVKVYSEPGGQLLGTRTFSLTSKLSNGQNVSTSATLKSSWDAIVYHRAYWGSSYSYIGYTWTEESTGMCYSGNCQDDFK